MKFCFLQICIHLIQVKKVLQKHTTWFVIRILQYLIDFSSNTLKVIFYVLSCYSLPILSMLVIRCQDLDQNLIYLTSVNINKSSCITYIHLPQLSNWMIIPWMGVKFSVKLSQKKLQSYGLRALTSCNSVLQIYPKVYEPKWWHITEMLTMWGCAHRVKVIFNGLLKIKSSWPNIICSNSVDELKYGL